MANKVNRLMMNSEGAYYVDDSCVDCDHCRATAPDFFKRDEDTGQSYVYRQPITADEKAQADAALDGCPTDSIGGDG